MKTLVGQGKPLHSAVDKAAGMLRRKVGTGAEFMKELMGLPGIKQTELQERGLTDIMGMPKMTHEQFMSELGKKPAPAVEEKVLSDKPEPLSMKELRVKANNVIRERAREYGSDNSDTTRESRSLAADEMRRLRSNHMGQALRIAQERHLEHSIPPHHETYTLPGGDNYREMLIKAPKANRYWAQKEKDTEKKFFDHPDEASRYAGTWGQAGMVEGAPESFKGVPAHFGGEPNILASMRLKDRKGPNGEKLLHLEELQSDWHQQGREKGYQGDVPDLTPEQKERIEELGEKIRHGLGTSAEIDESKALRDQSIKKMKATPDAPFKKNWEEMALKRLIHHAAEKGYHGIVVTPGVEQAKRYGLAQHVKELRHYNNENGTHDVEVHTHQNTPQHAAENVLRNKTPEQLAEYFGKDVAKQIVGNEGKAEGDSSWRTISGSGLTVGDEGMKGFYDKKVPNILNNIGKKYGVKTELGGHKLPGDPSQRGDASERLGVAGERFADMNPDQVQAFNQRLDDSNAKQLHYFPITEDMRKDVLTNGLPLYAQGGTVHKTEGGSMEPSQDEMKLALTNKKIAVKPAKKKAEKPKYLETDKPKRVLFPTSNSGAVKGIVVPRHMWEGGEDADGMKEINKARAAVYGSENRDPLHIGQVGRIHKQTLDEHFKRPIKEQKKIEMEALKRLREAKHLSPNADTLDASEKLDTVRHEYDEEGRSHVGFASKGVAGHALYTSGHGSNEVHHVINTCPGQTTGCGGGTDKNGIVDTSQGTCFAPNAESQYVGASVRRACHEQAKHDPAMTRDWILAHTKSIRNKAANADSNNERLLFRPNVVDETDVTSRHLIRHLNKQRKLEGKPPIIANSYGKTNELHDPENGYYVTYSNVGPKTKHGTSIEENIARDKNRVRQTVLAQDASGKDIRNEDGIKTPPKNSYMVTNVQRGSSMAEKMEGAITYAKYWSAGRPQNELNEAEKAEGPVGHFDGKGKPTTPANAHYGHNTLNEMRFDYQKQHILHPRLVQVGENDDGTPHMIPTDSRFKDEEFLPKKRFKTKSGKNAGAILMTTPTESTSRVGHHTSFTHDVNEKDIEHAKNNNGEYQIDHPAEQMAAAGKEYSPPQAIKIVRKAEGGSVKLGEEDFYGLGDDDFFAFPESNHAAQHHLAYRDEPVEKTKAKSMTLQQFKGQRVLHKAVGGAVNMRSLGVNEAPNMDIKAYFPPSPVTKPGELPMGGIPQPTPPQPAPPQQQPGMPPPGAPQDPQAPQMPGQPPQAPQMGGLPSMPPQGPPMGQPPSNILQMTRQGQAMNAMTPPR